MFGWFGKKKVKAGDLAPQLVAVVHEASTEGFPFIAEMLNEEQEFAQSPSIEAESNEWFRYIVYAGNLLHLEQYFDPEEASKLQGILATEISRFMGKDPETADSILFDYLDFMRSLDQQHKSLVKTMSLAIFHKYELNRFQKEHFQKLNTPNPVVMKDLMEVTGLFLWNWAVWLEEHKLLV